MAKPGHGSTRLPEHDARWGCQPCHFRSELLREVAFTATGLFYKNVSGYSGTLSIGGKIYPYKYTYTLESGEVNPHDLPSVRTRIIQKCQRLLIINDN